MLYHYLIMTDPLSASIIKHSQDIEALNHKIEQLTFAKCVAEMRKQLLIDNRATTQSESFLQDFKEMVEKDVACNVPIEYYEQPCSLRKHHPYMNGVKKTARLFDVIKEARASALLPKDTRKIFTQYEFDNQSGSAFGPSISKRTDVRVVLPNPYISETTDKFVAILNIIIQQYARIAELERALGPSGRSFNSTAV